MGRPTINHVPAIIEQAEDIQALDHRASVRADVTAASERAHAAASAVGYQLPEGWPDPDLIQRDISANMRRGVEACLEVGRGLLVLKAVCAYGTFLPRLEVLGIDDRVARRFMQAAAKFSNRSTSPDLIKAIGSQSKLFELLILDDDDVESLEETGQIGGLTLDKIDRMGIRELRKELRELQKQKAALGELQADTARGKEALQLENITLKSHSADGEAARQIADKKARQAALFETTNAVHDAICDFNQALADMMVDRLDYPMCQLANNAAAEIHWLLDQLFLDRTLELPEGYMPVRRLAEVVYSARSGGVLKGGAFYEPR